MPRQYPAGLLTSPTLCTAVLIQTASNYGIGDFGLTDAVVPFTYNGQFYQTTYGADASNIQQESGTSVDNLQVSTLLNDAMNYILTRDVIGRRFENSRWTLFQIDYTNPSNGAMILARYRLAKTTLTDVEQKMELLGLISMLKIQTGRSYGITCDVLRFGDIRCDPTQTIRAGRTDALTVGAVQNLFTIDFFGSSRSSYYYSNGDATWTSGGNNNLTDQIKYHLSLTPAAYNAATVYNLSDYCTEGGHTYYSLLQGNTGNTPGSSPYWQVVTGNPGNVARIVWQTPAAYPVSVGDTANVCFGCDRRKATCSSVTQTANPSGTNVENFHGYYMPSPDEMQVIGRPNS